jgi:hypothetical protein
VELCCQQVENMELKTKRKIVETILGILIGATVLMIVFIIVPMVSSPLGVMPPP